MPETPQEQGRRWEREGMKLVGGRLMPGSGNQAYALGDGRTGAEIVWSFKHTIHGRSPVDASVIEDARHMALDSGSTGMADVIAYKLGNGMQRADLDLMQLLAWIAKPPEIVPATSNAAVHQTAKTPPFMR